MGDAGRARRLHQGRAVAAFAVVTFRVRHLDREYAGDTAHRSGQRRGIVHIATDQLRAGVVQSTGSLGGRIASQYSHAMPASQKRTGG